MNLIQQYFPNTPVYATLGNHESHPSDTYKNATITNDMYVYIITVNLLFPFYHCSFAPPEITDEAFNTNWLYDVAARQWARWLPAEVSSTIRYGGYYTAVVQPGLRVISLNTNYCYTGNWWTLSKSQDPASSLLWLNKVLEDAERAGEKVIDFIKFCQSMKLKFKVLISLC